MIRRVDVKSFRGDFGLTLRIRRDTFEEMEAVAQQLLGLFPDDTIHIDRRIARVKLKAAPETPGAHPPRAQRPDREGSSPAALPVTTLERQK